MLGAYSNPWRWPWDLFCTRQRYRKWNFPSRVMLEFRRSDRTHGLFNVATINRKSLILDSQLKQLLDLCSDMEGDAVTSHQEQISLYGLFGDSSATLQGLNDHLSPSLLQQSPPCGSTLAGHTTVTKAVIMSPPRQSLTNGMQHGGMLLSDLADRSPSAGSITAASLCNFVSYGNQRCTNLVTIKGKRLCSQHSGEPVSKVKKAIFKKPATTSTKQIGELLPITNSELLEGNIGQKFIRAAYNPTTLTAVSNVQNSSSSTVTPKVNGIDVSDNVKFTHLTDSKNQHKNQHVHLVKKVGKTITVSRRPVPPTKGGETSSKADPTSTVTNTGGYLQSSPTKAMTTMLKTNSARGRLAPYNIPYYKKLEPVTVSSQLMESRTTRTQSTPMSHSSSVQTSTFAVTKQSGGNDETLRKLFEVLNGKNTNVQEQLSILQSMGVTIVQAPTTSSNYPFKKNHGLNVESARTENSEGISADNTAPSNPVAPPNASLNHTVSALNAEKIREKLSSKVKSLSNVEQTGKEITKPSPTTGKAKKSAAKSGQKRKQKQTDDNPQKKSKSDEKAIAAALVTASSKKAAFLKTQSERSKVKKSNAIGQKQQLSLISPNAQPQSVTVPTSSGAFQILVQYLNEKTLLETDLFIDRELPVHKGVSKGDRSKALKQRLLKEHARNKCRKATGSSLDYEQCLKNLDRTDPFKVLCAADHLRTSLTTEKQTKKTIHHERVLDKLDKPSELCDLSYKHIPDLDITPADDITDENIAFTLDTLWMKEKYRSLSEELDREESELEMLSFCFGENPKLGMETVNSYMNRTRSDRLLQIQSRPKQLLCQLSSDKGLRCNKKVLPYANYCKEHIWHCETQCLYKLDQNMKTVADINPEPMVKRVRKRAKLLPLIKKYKKKKKKKVDGVDQPDETKLDHDESVALKVPNKSDAKNNANRPAVQKSAALTVKNVLGPKSEQVQQTMNFEDGKLLDSSDDDLNLMTNEIMLSGVLDKLQDDAQDFDLFSEKNAKELERALLMAAASPTHEEHTDGQPNHGSSSSQVLSSRPDSLSDLDPGLLLGPRLNSSPDAIINCDAPKSAEPPPALDQFNESQIAHYTFGSSMGGLIKKECNEESYPVEEAPPPLISAEDLQDLEGVLERLDAEDANSPKVPSTPAMDQYTSMLARQLSQEVEGESLKREAASASMVQSIGQSFKTPQSPSLSTSYSLSSSEMSLTSSPLNRNKSPMQLQYSGTSANSPLPQSPNAQFKKPNTLNLGNRITVSSAIEVKNAASLPQEVLPSPKTKAMSKAVNSLAMSSGFNPTTVVANAFSSGTKVKTSKSVPISGHLNTISGGSIQRLTHRKMSQTGTGVVQNQVVPLTLMQSQQSQGGNVIKVIVPPGTIINGSNGQQNMLLIPVSALMKSNLQSGGQHVVTSPGHNNTSQGGTAVNVKPVNNLMAGQQFFIVNNPSAVTSHAHTQLTLVQKPGTLNSQQSIMLKSQNTTKDRNTYVRRQLSHDQAKQNQSMKSPLNMQLKFGINHSEQKDKVSTFAISSTMSTVVSSVSSQTLPYGTVTKVVAAQAGKMTVARNQGGRRKSKSTPRKPKARFDPITRKYVPVTDAPVSSPVTSVPDSIMTSPLSHRTESLIKFNESTLTIQNKVQQIDSVLSCLNAASKGHVALVKGNHDLMKSKSSVQVVKSVASPISNEMSIMANLKSTQSKSVASTSGIVVQAKAGTPLPKISSSSHHVGNILTSASGVALKQVQKTVPVVLNKSEISIKDLPKSALKNVSAPVTTSKISVSTAASGTVHWNQTTTAGPEISTTALTVPVYITGAISANAWGGELTMARSLSGSALPVILPARKAGTNGQLTQRVLLSNLASSGLTKVSSGSTSLLKQSLISLPQSVVTLPKTKLSLATSPKDVGKSSLIQSDHPANKALGQATTLRMEVGSKVPGSITASSSQNCVSVSVASTTRVPILVAASAKSHALNDDVVSQRKSGRKTSHDTILKDTLTTDPMVLGSSSQ